MSETEKYEGIIKKESEKIDRNKVQNLLSLEEKFWALVEKVKLLKKEIYKLRILWEMIKDYIKGDYKEVPWSTITAIVAILLYILNPVDLIPDAIPGVGFIDDAMVLAVGWKMVQEDIENYSSWKCKQQEIPPSLLEAINQTFGCKITEDAES